MEAAGVKQPRWVSSAGGNKLQTTAKMEDPRTEVKLDPSKASAPLPGLQDTKADASDPLSCSALAALQSDVQPVGHDYVEEVGLAGGLRRRVQTSDPDVAAPLLGAQR